MLVRKATLGIWSLSLFWKITSASAEAKNRGKSIADRMCKGNYKGEIMTIKEKAECIVKDIKQELGTSPLRIFKDIAEKEYISLHGPEHHIQDGASLLVA